MVDDAAVARILSFVGCRNSVRGQLNSVRGQLIRGGTGSVGVKLANTVLAFFVSVVLARTLGPEGFGVYAFIYALVMIMAVPVQLGLPQLVVRETAKAHAKEQWSLMFGLWRWTTGAVFLFSTVIIVLVLLSIWMLEDHLDEQKAETMYFALALVVLIALGSLRSAALRGLRRVVLAQLPEAILRPALLILLVLTAGWTFPHAALTPASAMSLNAVAAAVAFATNNWLLWRSRPMPLASETRRAYDARHWTRATLPLALIGGVQIINQYTDILMLGMLRTDVEVGIYRVVAQGAMLVIFGLQAVNMVVMPYFARLYAQGDMQRLRRLVTQSARVILLLALPVVLAIVFLGDLILRGVFGDAYASGYAAFVILAIGQLVNAVMGSVGILLNMTGHERDTLRGVSLAALANILLNALLIPAFGIEGAALATAMTLTIWNLFLWRAVHYRLGIESMAINPFIHNTRQ